MTQGLVARNLYSKVDFLNQQQKVAALQGDISVLKASIPKAEAAAQEALQKYELRKAEMNSQIVEEINKRRAELASLTESLAAGSDRVTRTELKSPVRGTIKQIMLKTVGGVAKPGEPIMEIVPLDDTLLVETRIRPGDIAFIRPNQKAMVKVTAYDFSICRAKWSRSAPTPLKIARAICSMWPKYALPATPSSTAGNNCRSFRAWCARWTS